MFHTFGVFETPFLTGFDIFDQMFLVPPPEQYDQFIFAWVRNLAGGHSCMAISADFLLNQMGIVFSSGGGYFAIKCAYFELVSSYFVRYFEGACSLLVKEKYV